MDEDLGKEWRDGCWETAAAHFDGGARQLEMVAFPSGYLTDLTPSQREGILDIMVDHAEFEVLNERLYQRMITPEAPVPYLTRATRAWQRLKRTVRYRLAVWMEWSPWRAEFPAPPEFPLW